MKNMKNKDIVFIFFVDYDETSAISLIEREHKGSPAVFLFSSSVSVVEKDGSFQKIDSNWIDNAATFSQNLKYWNKETRFISTNNFDNSYFLEIVNMGVGAVPFIIEELKKGPTPLVHALDMIFPNIVKYEGFVSLKDACDKWLSILQQTVNH